MQRAEAYRVLGLNPHTDVADVKARYRQLVKQIHPDAGGGGESSSEDGRVAGAGTAVLGEGPDLALLVEAYRTVADTAVGPGRASVSRRTPAQSPRSRRNRTRAAEGQPEPPSGRAFFALGRLATTAADHAVRRNAVRSLGRSGRHSAAVFLKQAVFDSDAEVGREAAAALARMPGTRLETELIELFDQLSTVQRRAVLEVLIETGRAMPHLGAYAAADGDPGVADCARELLS